MNTRNRGRRSNTAAQPSQSTANHGRFRITIVETTLGNEVNLCNTCTHRVNELQHDEAAFVLKSEYEEVKNEAMEEDYVEVNALDDMEQQSESLAKKERSARASKTRNKRRFGYDHMISKVANNAEVKYPIQQKKVIFPESEYDVLEKKLIELEFKLANVSDNGEEFKKLCKTGVLCEERWATLYCRDYNKPLDEYRNEAISVLKHNLDIRRGEGIRPAVKPTDGTPIRQIKRDHTTVNPSVSIASGRIGNPANMPREFFRSPSKRNFGQCIPITTLAMGPLNVYTNVTNDPCYMIENVLFDVESRLKRCEPDSKEFRALVEEGRQLREEWSQTNEQLRDTKPQDQNLPNYDISKCVVLGRTRRARINEEYVVDIVE
ncbi:hypothetical protein M3Y97_00525000 [Aphelenchoides bicaudatus]|nr:hypothetical protein M3Y97_00525000 [Aphelenchoides bicaudatus]